MRVDGLALNVGTQIKAVILRASIITESVLTTIVENDVVFATGARPIVGHVLGVISSVDW